jgi:hypothetical protein
VVAVPERQAMRRLTLLVFRFPEEAVLLVPERELWVRCRGRGLFLIALVALSLGVRGRLGCRRLSLEARARLDDRARRRRGLTRAGRVLRGLNDRVCRRLSADRAGARGDRR